MPAGSGMPESMQPRHHSLGVVELVNIRLLRLTTVHCNLSLVLQGANFDTNVFDLITVNTVRHKYNPTKQAEGFKI